MQIKRFQNFFFSHNLINLKKILDTSFNVIICDKPEAPDMLLQKMINDSGIKNYY